MACVKHIYLSLNEQVYPSCRCRVGCIRKYWRHGEMTRNNSLVPSLIISGPRGVAAMLLLFNVVTVILMCVKYCNC